MRQVPATRIWGFPAGGNVGVFGKEQRLVASVLDESRNRSRANRVMRREVSDSELDRAAVRFATDSDDISKLSLDERKSLNDFVKFLSDYGARGPDGKRLRSFLRLWNRPC